MRARSRAVVIAFLALAIVGCGGAKAPDPSNPVRSASAPSDLLPEDLDFVVRVDVDRLEQDAVLASVVREIVQKSGTTWMDEVGRAFQRSSAVYVGGRWMSDGFHGDGVIVIESREAGDEGARGEREAVETSEPSVALREHDGGTSDRAVDGFRRRASPSRDVEVFERKAESRGEAALKVVFRGRGVVLATLAEMDAVLRVLGSGADRGRLDPPARGIVSFAGRALGTFFSSANGGAGVLAACAAGLHGYAGAIEPGDAIRVEASLHYGSEDERSRAATCVRNLLGRLATLQPKLRSIGDSTRLTEIGRSLRIEAAVPFAWLGALR